MKKVYLDYNATTPVLPKVLNAMLPFFSEKFGNPASSHSFGREAASALELAAEQVAALIGATANEIIFTRGGSEANNLAISELALKGKTRIISSKVEHSSTYDTCKRLKKDGFEVTYLDVNRDGLIDAEALEQALDNDVALVSLLLVNNETGTIQDFESIRKVMQKYDVPLHYDAVQAAGKMPLDVDSLGASLLSLSAHKIYGPKGAGALYVRSGIELEAPSGTYDLPGIVGLGAACEIARGKLDVYAAHCTEMRDYLERGIMKACLMATINGCRKQRICNTTNISFSGFSAKNLSEEFDRRGIAVSTGAACNERTNDTSRILEAMNVPKAALYGALRFSVGKYSNKADIDYFIKELIKILQEKNKAMGGSKIIKLDI
ncbi:MAG: cysteine desulfurase [Victivallales bacterium]|nr:cysteine desulfurase [Victivallales bacterium]